MARTAARKRGWLSSSTFRSGSALPSAIGRPSVIGLIGLDWQNRDLSRKRRFFPAIDGEPSLLGRIDLAIAVGFAGKSLECGDRQSPHGRIVGVQLFDNVTQRDLVVILGRTLK